jgi:hypothetical protein
MDSQEREEQRVKREIREYQRTFTEEECHSRLKKQLWPEGFKCPECGHSEAYYKRRRKLYQCKNKKCEHQTSVTSSHNFFHGTKIPLEKWFIVITLIFENMLPKIRKSELQTILKIGSSRTLYQMIYKIEEAFNDPELKEKLFELIEE